MDFLVHLFHDKQLQSGTVAHYRSALAVPLKLQYKVELNDHAVTMLLRAMSLQRPRVPVAAPVWSLNKVLTYIDGLPMRLNTEYLLQIKCFSTKAGYRVENQRASCMRQGYRIVQFLR